MRFINNDQVKECFETFGWLLGMTASSEYSRYSNEVSQPAWQVQFKRFKEWHVKIVDSRNRDIKINRLHQHPPRKHISDAERNLLTHLVHDLNIAGSYLAQSLSSSDDFSSDDFSSEEEEGGKQIDSESEQNSKGTARSGKKTIIEKAEEHEKYIASRKETGESSSEKNDFQHEVLRPASSPENVKTGLKGYFKCIAKTIDCLTHTTELAQLHLDARRHAGYRQYQMEDVQDGRDKTKEDVQKMFIDLHAKFCTMADHRQQKLDDVIAGQEKTQEEVRGLKRRRGI